MSLVRPPVRQALTVLGAVVLLASPVHGACRASVVGPPLHGGSGSDDNPPVSQPRSRGFPLFRLSSVCPRTTMSRNYYSEMHLHVVWHAKLSRPLLTPE